MFHFPHLRLEPIGRQEYKLKLEKVFKKFPFVQLCHNNILINTKLLHDLKSLQYEHLSYLCLYMSSKLSFQHPIWEAVLMIPTVHGELRLELGQPDWCP